MVLVAERSGEVLERFVTVGADPNKEFEDAHRDYKRLCKGLGYTDKIRSRDSFGFIAYSNGKGQILLKRVE
jgi:hypothetical protein